MLKLLILFAASAVWLSPALAQEASPAAAPAADASGPAQFFLLSFNEAPVAEAVEGVAGGLNEPATLAEGVSGSVSFKAEGWYTPDTLLREFGSALLDRDLALVRDSSGELAVILEPNLPLAEKDGAMVLAVTAAPLPAVGPAVSGAEPALARYGERRGDGPWGYLLAFLAGMGTLAAGLWTRPHVLTLVDRLKSPRLPKRPVLQIAFQPAPVVEEVVDPELAVPEAPHLTMRKL